MIFSRYIMYKEHPDEGGNRPTVYEAEKYHDLLANMLQSEEFRATLSSDEVTVMAVAHDILCWTLGHDNNGTLEIQLRKWGKQLDDFNGARDHFDN